MESWVSRLFHHLKELRNRREKGKESVVRVRGSQAVKRVVEEDIVSPVLVLGLPKRLGARTQIVQEKLGQR